MSHDTHRWNKIYDIIAAGYTWEMTVDLLNQLCNKEMGLVATIFSGKLYCKVEDFDVEAERLLNRPVLTHEMASEVLWKELRDAKARELLKELE